VTIEVDFLLKTPLQIPVKHKIACKIDEKVEIGTGYLPGGSTRSNGPLNLPESINQFHRYTMFKVFLPQ